MELKHGTVRLDAAAAWLSKTTGRKFTADDLIDAHDKLPVYALIPKSLARPEYSAAVLHAVSKQGAEVAAAAGCMTKEVPLKLVDIAELATETLPEDAALRYKWERVAHEEGVYLLTARDLELLDIHGVQQLHRGVSVFNQWIGRPIQFGNPVDVTLDMLVVRRSQLAKFAELVGAEQAASPERPVSEQEAEPRSDEVQSVAMSRQRHQEHEILRVLSDMRYDPKRLPDREKGKPGIKAAVRAKLKGMTKSVFDHAWDRLRAGGEIVGGK